MNKPLELRKFVAPEFIFGTGALEMTGRYAKNLGGEKALIVTDPGVIEAGWADKVIASLNEQSIPYTVFSEVTPNPKDFEVMKGAEVFSAEECNLIVTVGGGSPMDCAKGIGVVSSNGGYILDYEGVDMISNPIPPIICIPTTAGTSADVSQFAIIADIPNKTKIAIISKMLVPDVALVDPETTTTMDSYLTACTGMDALTHAIEAYVSNASSPVTDLLALNAIRLISGNLIKAIENPFDLTYRTPMMLGSLEAGLAFSNASLGAVHAMAHSLGGLMDLPHGECNAILLEYVVDYNFESSAERYSGIAEAFGINISGISNVQKKNQLVDRIRTFRKNAGILKSLHDIGVNPDSIGALSENAYKDPCLVTNPAEPTLNDIKELYARAIG
ncbi:MAG: iron-containing alcohol dehydrogenase [Firmicutes bacterium]|nr:iron-containing alcohol dehydrogenase [Bacillota bacterium]